MAPEGNVTAASSFLPSRDSKKYNRIKLGTGIVSSLLSFMLLVWFVSAGFSRVTAEWCMVMLPNVYGQLLLFVALVGGGQFVLLLPLSWYSGYVIEHRFGLSNQSPGRWAWEKAKGILISIPLALGVVVILMVCLRSWEELWWLPVGCALTVLSVVLARLAPTVILPLFYRLTPLMDGPLKDRILERCTQAGVHVEGIFTFNLSKNTKKANAAFTGIGKSRRIILGDTLVHEFTDEEIETVFAHELGHYRFHHVAVGMLIGTCSTFLGLFLAAEAYHWSLAAAGFASVADLGALPLLALWLSLYGLATGPIGNMVSRRHERQADRYAVTSTRNPAAFIAALRKLSSMNLADPEPHPLVEFLFYSHPSIGNRIRAIASMPV